MNLKLVIALKRSMGNLNRDEAKHIREAGITYSQFGVLEALYHKGDLNVCEIIEKTLSTGGNMTVVINNLEKDGYISRYRDPDDGRAYKVSISEKGKSLIEEIWPKHLEMVESKFGFLDFKEKNELLNLLKKMNGMA